MAKDKLRQEDIKPVNKEYSKFTIISVSILAVLLILSMLSYGYIVGTYNKVQVARQDMKTQWSHVTTEYQRRADLFVNMAEIAQNYASFEKSTFSDVAAARSGAGQLSSSSLPRAEEMQTMNGLEGAFARLLVVFEKYPELKSIEQYNQLLQEVQRTENRVQVARTDYNNLVRSYNILVTRFPRNVIASHFGYYEEDTFFDNEPGTEKAPKLNMKEFN